MTKLESDLTIYKSFEEKYICPEHDICALESANISTQELRDEISTLIFPFVLDYACKLIWTVPIWQYFRYTNIQTLTDAQTKLERFRLNSFSYRELLLQGNYHRGYCYLS